MTWQRSPLCLTIPHPRLLFDLSFLLGGSPLLPPPLPHPHRHTQPAGPCVSVGLVTRGGSPWVDTQRIHPGPAQDSGPPDAQHFLDHHLFSAPDPTASCRKLPGPRPSARLSSLPCPLACAQHSSPPSLVALRFLEAKCDLPKVWSPSSALPLVEVEPSAIREATQGPTEKIPHRENSPQNRLPAIQHWRARGLLEREQPLPPLG